VRVSLSARLIQVLRRMDVSTFVQDSAYPSKYFSIESEETQPKCVLRSMCNPGRYPDKLLAGATTDQKFGVEYVADGYSHAADIDAYSLETYIARACFSKWKAPVVQEHIVSGSRPLAVAPISDGKDFLSRCTRTQHYRAR